MDGSPLAGGVAALLVVAAVSVPVLAAGDTPAGPPKDAVLTAAAALQARLRAAALGELDAVLPAGEGDATNLHVADVPAFDSDVRGLSAWGRRTQTIGRVGDVHVVFSWSTYATAGGVLTLSGVEHDELDLGTTVNGGDGVGEQTTYSGVVERFSSPVTVQLVRSRGTWLVQHVRPVDGSTLTAQGGF